MAGKITGGVKESVFDVKAKEVNIIPTEAPEKPKYPPTLNIKKAEGGYVVEKSGGEEGDNWPRKEYIYKTYDEAVEACKSHMESPKKKDG